ncbi:hypothetical protein BJ944DRAFT_268931 [Cunninghamella echinulata]|nr:hypothetical protein BJ944DRAFT_268931 [Cunninghamella echinulata]
MSQKLASLSRVFINKSYFTPNVTPLVRQSLRTYTKEVAGVKEHQVTTAKEQGGKFKQLAKKYGPSGILVYLGVGCIDLGLTFVTIQLVGAEKVKKIERIAIDTYHETKEKFGFKTTTAKIDGGIDGGNGNENGIVKPTAFNKNDDLQPSLASVFLLSYGIHKTLLLPVRLAITTAITPAFVRKIHALGWAKYAPRLFGIPKNP